jgi:hypothetical protein
MRTGASFADFSALQVKFFVMAINVSKTNNEKVACLIRVIVPTSDIQT